MTKNVIIVGAPRSGTSLTAAIFARKGYYVGGIEKADAREGDDNNPFGYFEADGLIERNVQVFRRAGFNFHNTWLFDMISERSLADIAAMDPCDEHRRFVESYKGRSPWLWKDPRLCFTLSYWWKLMDPATTGVLLVRREPSEVYRSFRRMGWCDATGTARARVYKRIERHLRAAEEAASSSQISHCAVDYCDYASRPAMVARRISTFCGLDLSMEDLNVHVDLNHSTVRGRVASHLRMSLDHGALRHLRLLRRLVPPHWLAVLLPEKKYGNPKA